MVPASKKIAAVFIFALLISAATATVWVNSAVANPDTSNLIMVMPEEYVHYTITRVNGTLWAKVDGTYPLQILTEIDDASICLPTELPMIYPTPPDTTNIYVSANHAELEWSNYPYETHHTAIGDWLMIYCLITPVQEQCLLKIHYEHPVQQINGSYIFLYDLNISPYLSPQSLNSTAYFTIRMETDVSNLRVYTTETDSVSNPMNITTRKEGTKELISIQMYSENSKPLAGDLVVTFSDFAVQMPDELPYWIGLPLLIIAALLAATVHRRKCRQSASPR